MSIREWWVRQRVEWRLDREFLSNPLEQWLLAVAVLVLAGVLLRAAKGIVRQRAKTLDERYPGRLFGLVVELAGATKLWFILGVSVWLGSLVLVLPDKARRAVEAAAILVLVVQGALWGSRLIGWFITRDAKQRLQTDAATVTTLAAVGFLAKVALWSVALLLILANMGVDITALVAGLGVGGIAVALAAQNILGDLFASLSIVLDKPFVLGDFIAVGSDMGTVENIGLKTTRVRALSGEQLIFSNNDLLQSRIRNMKRQTERRVVFSLGVTYDTPVEQLEAIPGLIRAAIEQHEKTRFDRSHFQKFGDWSLVFETVYFVTVPDYALYMDIQQAINLRLLREFAGRGIEMAFPTQVVLSREVEESKGRRVEGSGGRH